MDDRQQNDSEHSQAGQSKLGQSQFRPGESDEGRPPMALAMEWVSKITTVALEMVLPGLLGNWLDDKWGTRYLGLAGFALGAVVGIWHLLRMTKAVGQRSPGKPRGDSRSTDKE